MPQQACFVCAWYDIRAVAERGYYLRVSRGLKVSRSVEYIRYIYITAVSHTPSAVNVGSIGLLRE